MPTKRRRLARPKRRAIPRDVVAWLRGKAPMPIAGYFIWDEEKAELSRLIAAGDFIECEPED
jgi:hypothetical protein